jgi:hypothetical protein
MATKRISLYYALWCGHCMEFKPTWNNFKKYLELHKDDISKKYHITIKTEEFEDSKDGEQIEEKKITGFPTIHIDDEPYEDDRTMAAMIKALIPTISDDDIKDWFPEEPKRGGKTINDAAMNFLDTLNSMEGGGRSVFYAKYMKYKAKYLKIKN